MVTSRDGPPGVRAAARRAPQSRRTRSDPGPQVVGKTPVKTGMNAVKHSSAWLFGRAKSR